MAAGELSMKNVLAQLEQKQRSAADKPKPPVTKPTLPAATQPPSFKPLKPVVQSPKPAIAQSSETADSGKPSTNGVTKWPPVKTTVGTKQQCDTKADSSQASTGPNTVTKFGSKPSGADGSSGSNSFPRPCPKAFGANSSGPSPVLKSNLKPFGTNTSAGVADTSVVSPVLSKPESPQVSESSELSPNTKPGPFGASPSTLGHVQPAAGRGRGIKIPPFATLKPEAKSPGVKSPVGVKLIEEETQKAAYQAASATVQSQQTAASEDENLPAPPWKAQLKKRGSAVGDAKSDNNNNVSSSSNSQTVASAVARKIPTSSTVSDIKERIAKSQKIDPLNKDEAVTVARQTSSGIREPESNVAEPADERGAVTHSHSAKADSTNAIDKSMSKDDATSGSKSYRLVTFSDVAPRTAAPRKPAKPPSVDLTAYRQQADIGDDADDGEIYDDVKCSSDDILRQNSRPVSTVSRISEFTEEEETGSRLQRQHGGNEIVEEIYDDVGGNHEDFQDGLIYQELD
jgi:hypothetical protein